MNIIYQKILIPLIFYDTFSEGCKTIVTFAEDLIKYAKELNDPVIFSYDTTFLLGEYLFRINMK